MRLDTRQNGRVPSQRQPELGRHKKCQERERDPGTDGARFRREEMKPHSGAVDKDQPRTRQRAIEAGEADDPGTMFLLVGDHRDLRGELLRVFT
jgi:hypothetical protein